MSTTETRVVTEGREVLSRAVRQTIQSLIPTLLVIAGGSTVGISVTAVATLAGMTALVSVLKSAVNLKASPEAPAWVQFGERAVTAAAGTAIGLITVDGVVASAEVDWGTTLTASIGSAVLAVVMFYTNPPVVPADVVEGEIVGEPVDVPPGTTFFGDDGTTATFDPEATTVDSSPFPRPRDGGYTELLVVLGVATLIGVVLLLFGVSFK